MRALILDLDNTIVDSSIALEQRQKRNWSEVYRLIGQFKIYDDVTELLGILRDRNIALAIVTSSPRPYYERVTKCFAINVNASVCFHDTAMHKPHPEPINLALGQLGIGNEDVVSLGDEPRDIEAARAAKVVSVGATWGTLDLAALRNSSPDFLCTTPLELLRFFPG